MALWPAERYVFVGTPVSINLVGTDNHNNNSPISWEYAEATLNTPGGAISGGVFTPTVAGRHTINATYRGMSASVEVHALNARSLVPAVRELRMGERDARDLSFSGFSDGGRYMSARGAPISYTVNPPWLGVVQNGRFYTTGSGIGYIRASLGNAVAYVSVISRFASRPVSPLNGGTAVSAAAPAIFSPRLEVSAPADRLGLTVYGNGSGARLRGQIRDATGAERTIDFAHAIDFTGSRSAAIPPGLTFPVYVERIFVEAAGSEAGSSGIVISNLTALSVDSTPSTPATPAFSDPAHVWSASYDLAFMPDVFRGSGNAAPERIAALRSEAAGRLSGMARMGVYLGSDAFSSFMRNTGYQRREIENALLISTASRQSGMIAANASQWASLSADVSSYTGRNIIIFTDTSPFSWAEHERRMFIRLMEDLADSGKQVAVVSNEWTNTTVNTQNGVRYINLGRLFNDNGTVNPNFSTVRFNFTESGFTYFVERISL